MCSKHYLAWYHVAAKASTNDIRRTNPGRGCKVAGCARKHYGHGYCDSHLNQLQRYGTTERHVWQKELKCSVVGCDQKRRTNGWCEKHYSRWLKNGTMEVRHVYGPGARYLAKDGYWMAYDQSRGRAHLEHRSVMERRIGRFLLPHENVHHINGDRLDNRDENLELWSKSQPCGQRIPDKVAWARQLLELYDPTPEYGITGC
jgi:HNH endonuclease